MAKVYIAGPMRGLPNLNFAAFDKASELGRSLGWTVINPADMDRENGIFGTEANADTMNSEPQNIRVFARRDMDALLSFKAEDGDAIALLPGWEMSMGAKAEHALACWLKLAIIDATNFHWYRPSSQASVIADILAERKRQDTKWGIQHHPLELWYTILGEEFGELGEAILNKRFGGINKPGSSLEEEAVQVAAVAVSMLEDIRRNK